MSLESSAIVSRPEAPPTDAWRDPLGLLLASTGEGVFGVDLDGLCVFINHAGALPDDGFSLGVAPQFHEAHGREGLGLAELHQGLR